MRKKHIVCQMTICAIHSLFVCLFQSEKLLDSWVCLKFMWTECFHYNVVLCTHSVCLCANYCVYSACVCDIAEAICV